MNFCLILVRLDTHMYNHTHIPAHTHTPKHAHLYTHIYMHALTYTDDYGSMALMASRHFLSISLNLPASIEPAPSLFLSKPCLKALSSFIVA